MPLCIVFNCEHSVGVIMLCRVHLAPYPVGTGRPFPVGKAAGALS